VTSPCQVLPLPATGNPEPPAVPSQAGPTPPRSGAVRRVVQIVEVDQRLLALCSDGSIWVHSGLEGTWEAVSLPPGCGGGE
jgi:hypothetical protein